MKRIHQDDEVREGFMLDLDEIARQGARRMLALALEAEVQAYIDSASAERDQRDYALVAKNGHAREREIVLGAGSAKAKAPRVNDRRVDEKGERKRFRSVGVPPYMRKSPKVSEVLPLLYLHGLSSGDFVPALEEFFGSGAGLSSATKTRLTEQWRAEREDFMNRDLSDRDYVYGWVDGIHTGVRLGSGGRLCCLLVLGARLDGTKELVAVEDGYRESEETWAALLRDLKKRGMRAPELAVGDGALGFWSALRDVFPETRVQRDWVHKTTNVLDSMQKSVHARAKAAIREITGAGNKRGRKGRRGVRWRVRGEVAEGDRKDRLREGSPARLLRLPGRALDPPSHVQPDRIGVRTGSGKDGRDEGCGFEGGGPGYDLQADGGHRGEVEEAQRASSRCSCESRSGIQGR